MIKDIKDLEKGKWYMSKTECTHLEAVKFNGIKNRGNYLAIKIIDVIKHGKYISAPYNGGFIYNNDFVRTLEEVPLKDIQIYLPNNHPDKIMTIAQQLKITDFPFRIMNKANQTIYFENSKGDWCRREYDISGREVYSEDSKGVIIDLRSKDIELTLEEIADKFGINVNSLKIKK
jgi:hypothetical protein